MARRTALYQFHQQAGAKLVNFVDWDMPLHYGSQLEEHHFVRQDAGIFDVSHMNIVDIEGCDAEAYLRYILATNIAKLAENGAAFYTCMLNTLGGIVDDLIVYRLAQDYWRLVLNAGTREKDFFWLQEHARPFQVLLHQRGDLSIIAIQGPEAKKKMATQLLLKEQQMLLDLSHFKSMTLDPWMIACTGYTGEDGLEIIGPNAQMGNLWQNLIMAGAKPCGLGARDSLRLEAGMLLYGSDMNETTSPLESDLEWTVAWKPEERNFIGRAALEQQKKVGPLRQMLGLTLEEGGILRAQQRVILEGLGEGRVTSGGFSPTLGYSIALARVPSGDLGPCFVELRDKRLPLNIVKPPFVRHGKRVYKTLLAAANFANG